MLSLTVAEKPRFFLKTGTSVGNSEASGYTTLHLRNLLGGGEALSLNASAGTRTRGSFGASLSTPIAGNPDVTAALEADSVTTTKPWASCDEGVARVGGKVSWRSATSGDRQTLGIATAWRTITGLLPTASPTVRADAGDSVKTSLTHTWLRERRDSPVLPHEGYMLRAATELAGWGPLGRVSDVAFLKGEWEAQGAVPLALPPSASLWSSLGRSAWEARLSKSGVALNIGLRAGLLYPLPLGAMDPTSSLAQPSRLPDRFTLGGPNDVRGFAQGGLGPRDGRDAVGGDVFAAGSAALVVPVTRGGRDSPLRLQLFANAGRLTALTGARGSGPVEKPSTTQPSNSPQGAMDATTVWKGVKAAVAELANGAPSSAAGIGLVYAHPVARFELNFSLPLALRRGEEGVKGLQIGVGVTYL